MENRGNHFYTHIWNEIAEHDNPFAASASYCHGYDVYGEILGKATWIEYLYLLFLGERPSAQQAALLEGLAIALAHPGIREPSVHAAMSAGAGGSTSASCLIAALAVGAGQLAGAREVFHVIGCWERCRTDMKAWQEALSLQDSKDLVDIWPAPEHPPGFDPQSTTSGSQIRHTLHFLTTMKPDGHLAWLQMHQNALEEVARYPLSLSGVAATAFFDLQLTPEQGEMLYLFLRLPGAAVQALEQKRLKGRGFPFFTDQVQLESQAEHVRGKADE